MPLRWGFNCSHGHRARFSNYTAFCYLIASMALQVLWSSALACLDGYALWIKRDIHNPVILSLFVVGDWVTTTLSLAAACSSAGVAVLFARDVHLCKTIPQSSCDRDDDDDETKSDSRYSNTRRFTEGAALLPPSSNFFIDNTMIQSNSCDQLRIVKHTDHDRGRRAVEKLNLELRLESDLPRQPPGNSSNRMLSHPGQCRLVAAGGASWTVDAAHGRPKTDIGGNATKLKFEVTRIGADQRNNSAVRNKHGFDTGDPGISFILMQKVGKGL